MRHFPAAQTRNAAHFDQEEVLATNNLFQSAMFDGLVHGQNRLTQQYSRQGSEGVQHSDISNLYQSRIGRKRGADGIGRSTVEFWWKQCGSRDPQRNSRRRPSLPRILV